MENQEKNSEITVLEVIKTSKLPESEQLAIQEKFSPFVKIAKEWKQKAFEIVVTDESQTELIKQARDGRIFVKNTRCAIENARKELKEDSLRKGQMIDKIAKDLTELITPIETHLENQEKYPEIMRENRELALANVRSEELQPYFEFIPSNLNLRTMSEEDYQKVLNMGKLTKTQKEEEDKKLKEENDRLQELEAKKRELFQERRNMLFTNGLNGFAAIIGTLSIETTEEEFNELVDQCKKDKAAHEEKEKEIAAEKERLKKQEEERIAETNRLNKLRSERNNIIAPYRGHEKPLDIDITSLSEEEFDLWVSAAIQGKEAYDKRKADEQAESKRLAELKAAEDAKLEEQRKLAVGPDKEKLIDYANKLKALSLPEVTDASSQSVVDNIVILREKMFNYILEQANKL